MDYSILGNVEDFQEFEKLYAPPPIQVPKVTHPEPEPEPEPEPISLPVLEDEQVQRREWLDKLHIFQRYREVREEHALANWKRHCIEWNKVEQTIAKSIQKVIDLT